MKRAFDIVLLIGSIITFTIPALIVAVVVAATSRGPVLYWSDRVGRRNTEFRMPKFRTMRVGTPAVATHLLQNPNAFLTPVGRFLRKASLDEIPQLWNIARGEMSFIGPRPALYNQKDLIALRTRLGIDELSPGLTGWAQVQGRDELSIDEKVALDQFYQEHQSVLFDIKIVFMTILKVISQKGVKH